jgi:hypothetical protein
MIAFVILMFLNIVLPYLRFVDSKGLDALDKIQGGKEGEQIVKAAKTLLIIMCII